MRIAYIVGSFPNISETFVISEIAGVAALGHEVSIFTTSRGVSVSQINLGEQQNLLQYTCRLNPPRNVFIRILATLALLILHGWQSPLTLFCSLNVARHGKLAAKLWLLHASLAIIRNGSRQYDVIHAQFGSYGNIAIKLMDIGAIEGALITTFRGYDATKVLHENPGYYSDLLKKGRLFLPVSDAIGQHLVSAGCRPEKMLVHHSGVDCDKINYSTKQRTPGELTHIITVARLVEKKGVEYSLRAVASAISSERQLTYTIIGDGPLRSYLERLAADLGISTHVLFLGSMNHADVLLQMAKSHILIAASVTAHNGDEEGMPIVLEEAMAQGLPVLSTYHSGIPELIEDSVSGYLVPERDVDTLAERLTYLIDHPEQWSAIGLAGRRRIEQMYCNSKLNEELVGIYESTVCRVRSE
jgi:colanic acid/amylovoran biosynthesis glycosyltransferase